MGEKWIDEEKQVPDSVLSEDDIEKALANITEPGERAQKAQWLRGFGQLGARLKKGEITADEFTEKIKPMLDSLG